MDAFCGWFDVTFGGSQENPAGQANQHNLPAAAQHVPVKQRALALYTLTHIDPITQHCLLQQLLWLLVMLFWGDVCVRAQNSGVQLQ